MWLLLPLGIGFQITFDVGLKPCLFFLIFSFHRECYDRNWNTVFCFVFNPICHLFFFYLWKQFAEERGFFTWWSNRGEQVPKNFKHPKIPNRWKCLGIIAIGWKGHCMEQVHCAGQENWDIPFDDSLYFWSGKFLSFFTLRN